MILIPLTALQDCKSVFNVPTASDYELSDNQAGLLLIPLPQALSGAATSVPLTPDQVLLFINNGIFSCACF